MRNDAIIRVICNCLDAFNSLPTEKLFIPHFPEATLHPSSPKCTSTILLYFPFLNHTSFLDTIPFPLSIALRPGLLQVAGST